MKTRKDSTYFFFYLRTSLLQLQQFHIFMNWNRVQMTSLQIHLTQNMACAFHDLATQ